MQDRPHRIAVHVLHREEVRVPELTDVVDLRDVRMLELRREPRFIEKHLQEMDVGGVLAQHSLHHDVALDATDTRTPREIDLGHSTGRELGEDLIAIRGRSGFGYSGFHALYNGTSECERAYVVTETVRISHVLVS
jgi:hypothetical protein